MEELLGSNDTIDAVRTSDMFVHIDMGFLNRRLAITALGPAREAYLDNVSSGTDHMTVLRNDHLLVTRLIDVAELMGAPTLIGAIESGKKKCVFMGIERLTPCPEIYKDSRVTHNILMECRTATTVSISYHTEHLVSSTGKMTLSEGYAAGYRQGIVGLLHRKNDKEYLVEPIVIGAPWLEHPRNENGAEAVWHGTDYGEILPEDIQEFSKMTEVKVSSADEWMSVMTNIPEKHVKQSIARLLAEPEKNDWGGEENDHFSSSVTISGKRKTAAFLLKGPSKFKEMTPAMCGKNGDQIYRLANCRADVSIVQHCHLVSPSVRETVRAFTMRPGYSPKFCIMDGQSTYRLLKAYNLLETKK